MKILILSILLGVQSAPSTQYFAPQTCKKVVITNSSTTERTEIKSGQSFEFQKGTHYFVDVVDSEGNVQMYERVNDKIISLWD